MRQVRVAVFQQVVFDWHVDNTTDTGTKDAVVTVVVLLHVVNKELGAPGIVFRPDVLVQYAPVPGSAIMFPSGQEHCTENVPHKGAVKLTFFLGEAAGTREKEKRRGREEPTC